VADTSSSALTDTVDGVPVRLDEADAVLRLTPGQSWWARLLPFLVRKKPFLRAELVWFPHYLVTFAMVAKEPCGEMTVIVEAWSGAFNVVDLKSGVQPIQPREPLFPPKLEPEAAVRLAKRNLTQVLLRQRSRGSKPLPHTVVENREVYLPFWIGYYEKKPGNIDFRVLDGTSGEKLGHRTRAGVLEALMFMDDKARGQGGEADTAEETHERKVS